MYQILYSSKHVHQGILASIALSILLFATPLHAFHCGNETSGHGPSGQTFECPDASDGGNQNTNNDGGNQNTNNDGGNQNTNTPDEIDASVKLFDPINKSVEEIFLAILDIIIVFAVPIVVFFIVWAGFLYVTAQGSETQLDKAKKALIYAIIGGLLVLGARVILEIITNTIDIFTN